MAIDICTECGGEGVLLSGETCSCVMEESVFGGFNDRVCTFIPEQYSSLTFSESLLPKLKSTYYNHYMDDLYKDVISGNLRNTNILVTSPPKSGKTVFAYSAIRTLFRKGLKVFPYMDMMEIRKIMNDIDQGKVYQYKDITSYDLDDLYECPYLFVKIPLELNTLVCDAMGMLVDRRTRRGNTTIFMSHVNWETLVKQDYNNSIKSIIGDGSFGTISNNNFY